jgi:hypothetical protein
VRTSSLEVNAIVDTDKLRSLLVRLAQKKYGKVQEGVFG